MRTGPIDGVPRVVEGVTARLGTSLEAWTGTDILNPNHAFLPRVSLELLGGERHIFVVECRDLDPPYDSFDPLTWAGRLPSVVSRNTVDRLLLWIALLLRRRPQAEPACLSGRWARFVLPGELIGNSNNFHEIARQAFDPLVDPRITVQSVAIIQPTAVKMTNIGPLCWGRPPIVRRYIRKIHPGRLSGRRPVVLDYNRPGFRPKDSPVMPNPDRPPPRSEVQVITGHGTIPPS
jgi:hypothetical protein